MAEWTREGIAELIRAYKVQENLYNPKNRLYFNKTARVNSLRKITANVSKIRPNTKDQEVSKKIQTLRTQFGQEVNKIEKSTQLGEELIYKPKIWWFPHLNWIGNFMKTRTDSTPLLEKVSKVAKIEKTEDETVLFEFEEAEESIENPEPYSTEIEYAEFEAESSEPPGKIQKTYHTSKASRLHMSETPDDCRTVEYTLINEDDTNDATRHSKKPEQFVEFHETDVKQNDKVKRRSKAFGKYIAALLTDITDDRIFFGLQNNITTAIHEATTKQAEARLCIF